MKRYSLYISAACAVFLIFPPAVINAKQEKSTEKEKKALVPFDEAIFDGMRTFAEVISLVDKKHYQINDAEKCMEKAIDGFLTYLDPHSGFLNQKNYKLILESTSGEFFGIGIVIDGTRKQQDKFLLIVDIIPEGPADNAGLKPLDKIVQIGEETLDGISTEEAISKLKGERHSTVHVKVLRENHPDIISVDIKRDSVKEQNSLCFYLEKQNVYYLSLTSFTESAVKQIETLLKNAQKKQYKALVLDLRNNSGGLLTAAIEIAGLFLEKGSEVVSTKDKYGKVTEKYTTAREPIANATLPIFVMVNNYTASAGEILAGCLKVHSEQLAKQTGSKAQTKLMVFVAGNQTFGKGSVFEVVPLSNNCAMKITTSLYFLPFDVSIQAIGIKPDFVLEKRLAPTDQVIWFKEHYGNEGVLKNAIKPVNQQDKKETPKEEVKKNKPDKEKSWSERAKETLAKDNQFREVISLINIFDESRRCCPENVSNRNKASAYLNKLYITDNDLTLTEVKM